MLLIFDQEPENEAASTSKVNTIESLPANKKSDCVCPLKRIDMPLLAHGQKIALGILLREMYNFFTIVIQQTTVQDQLMSLHLLVCA